MNKLRVQDAMLSALFVQGRLVLVAEFISRKKCTLLVL